MPRPMSILLLLLVILVGPEPASAAPGGAPGAAPDTGPDAGPAPRPADDRPYYFYHGRDYGSEALVHPLRLMINGGFGITQLSNRDNRLRKIPYERGWRNVWRNMRDPITTIEVEGWWDFLNREVIPVSINSSEAHYWPNYTQHLIGGGMSYRLMEEWFRHHGVGHSKAWSATTIMVYHLLNEVVEHSYYEDRRSTDPIADLYLFDPASILLFSSDRVARFFGETLNMADWSYQPLIDPAHGALVNNGQNFALKWPFPRSERWSLFYHFGTHAELGLSYRLPNGADLSAGAGFQADELLRVNEYHEGIDLAVSWGVFYDRGQSLLASLLMARTKDYKMRLNLYPGVLELGRWRPGFFVGINRDDSTMFGISLHHFGLPLGLATGHEPPITN